eukprot:13487704-Alexandrium_andersonii.AAC.1
MANKTYCHMSTRMYMFVVIADLASPLRLRAARPEQRPRQLCTTVLGESGAGCQVKRQVFQSD